MLVLTRKKDESVLIGDAIRVTVLEVNANSISVGIDAPDEVPILRAELLELQDGELSGSRTFELSCVG